jgi:hypothetical protein
MAQQELSGRFPTVIIILGREAAVQRGLLEGKRHPTKQRTDAPQGFALAGFHQPP